MLLPSSKQAKRGKLRVWVGWLTCRAVSAASHDRSSSTRKRTSVVLFRDSLIAGAPHYPLLLLLPFLPLLLLLLPSSYLCQKSSSLPPAVVSIILKRPSPPPARSKHRCRRRREVCPRREGGRLRVPRVPAQRVTIFQCGKANKRPYPLRGGGASRSKSRPRDAPPPSRSLLVYSRGGA
jgi:hypothetical protein